MNLRKPLVTLALATSALGPSLGVGVDPADAATYAGATTTAFSPTSLPTSDARSSFAIASLSHDPPDVEDNWTVEWQIMSTTSSSSAQDQPAVPARRLSGATSSRTNKAGPPASPHQRRR